MDDTNLAHLAGVMDATGYISIDITKDEGYTLGYRMVPSVSISRPANDGQNILMGKFMDYCEEQNVKYGVVQETFQDGKGKVRTRLTIKDRPSIEAFLTPLLPFLVSNYEPATIMIETVLPAFEDEKHLEKGGFYRLVTIAEELRKTRNRDSKYDTEYFAEEWSISQ